MEIIQSCMLRSQSSSRSSPNAGTQRTLRVISIIVWRSSSMEMNHSSTTRNTSSLLQRQQKG